MGTASERRRGKRRGSAGSSRRSCCRVGPSSYHRRLVLEPLEDRRLLSFDVTGWTDPIPAWTLEDNVECTGAYTGNGHLIDVYIKDLDYGFYTPSEWTWTPSCFEDPIIDLADLRTGYDTGWSFSIFRANTGDVYVCDAGYRLHAEILDHSVFDTKLYSQDITGPFFGSYNASFDASFDSNLEWASLDANFSLNLDFSESVPLATATIPIVPGTCVGLLDLKFGLKADVGLGFDASIEHEIVNGNVVIDTAAFAPYASIGLTGFGEVVVLGGLIGKGGASITGTVTQNFSADYAGGAWSYRAPGSLDVTGNLYGEILARMSPTNSLTLGKSRLGTSSTRQAPPPNRPATPSRTRQQRLPLVVYRVTLTIQR